jgi:hypothetical protein
MLPGPGNMVHNYTNVHKGYHPRTQQKEKEGQQKNHKNATDIHLYSLKMKNALVSV